MSNRGLILTLSTSLLIFLAGVNAVMVGAYLIDWGGIGLLPIKLPISSSSSTPISNEEFICL